MEARDQLAQAFEDIEQHSVHPSAEEIAAAADGVAASGFLLAEVKAHIAWCRQCQSIANSYAGFGAPQPAGVQTNADAEWRAMKARIAPPRKRTANFAGLAIAAGWILSAGIGAALWSLRPAPPPTIVEKRVEVPVEQPMLVADAGIVDLFPAGTVERGSGQPKAGPGTGSTAVTTFILHAPGVTAAMVDGRLLDDAGKVVWQGTLKRQPDGVFTLAARINVRPLTLEIAAGAGAGNPLRYRIY